MKLYKFRNVDTYSLTGIANSSLWFSNANEFNDPFEGIHILDEKLTGKDLKLLKEFITPKRESEIGTDNYNKMLSELDLKKNSFTETDLLQKYALYEFKRLVNLIHNSKMISFSMHSDTNNPLLENLMWSHYANGLRGFCLVFDKDELFLSIHNSSKLSALPVKVSYQDTPKKIKLSDFIKSKYFMNISGDRYVETVAKTVATKSKAWKYENEQRLLSLNPYNNHKYAPGALKEIIIGNKMPDDQKKLVINTVKSANSKIKIKEARLKQGSYKLEIVNI